MAGYKRVFINSEDFYSFTVGVNANTIRINPMPYMAVHTGSISGLQHLYLQGNELTEIAVADVDILLNVGKYAVDTSNSVCFVVDKITVDTEEKAKKYIEGFLLVYQMVSLQYSGDINIYTMYTYATDGTFIGGTNASSLTDLEYKMSILDKMQNINGITGYYYHILNRAISSL